MNWIRENKFLTALLAVVIVAAAALIYLLLQARAGFLETSERYEQQANELRRLQSLKPYPDQENLDRLTAQRDEYVAQVDAVRAKLADMEYELEPVSPEQFQDVLRSTVSEIEQLATEQGVALPEGFYLGFPEYQASPPRSEATARLSWQLKAITSVVRNLIQSKVISIESLTRTPLPSETRGATAAAEAGQELVRRYPFNIVLRTEQSRFRATLNQLANTKEQFLIVESLRIENESVDGPTRQLEVVPQVAETDEILAGGPEEVAQTLQFVVGTEKLTISLAISVVDFAEPNADAGGTE